MIANNQTLIALIITMIINFIVMMYLVRTKSKNVLKKVFIVTISLLILWCIGLILQITLSERLGIKPIYFDYLTYISICFVPITIFFIGLIYANTKITFKKIYLLLFIEPIVTLLILWTNDIHHLLYVQYSTNISETVYGSYAIVHNIFSYITLLIGIIYLLKFSIKNTGVFSKQSMLVVIGISVPVVTNILGTFKIIPMSIYVTPITFTIAIICCAVSIFKFKFLGVNPIALQKIVDRISDSFVVLDDNNEIIDFNQTFLTTFKLKSTDVRGINIEDFIHKQSYDIDVENLKAALAKVQDTDETISFEHTFKKVHKIFSIEINTISSERAYLGILILFKDITQHKEDMATIENNQNMLMERERLASLGQLIGGIAHNLKTPIMSISGAAEGLTDLVNELDNSIGNPVVNDDDYHDIAKDMREWLEKIRSYTEYMSDILTAVKGQAVKLSEEEEMSFTIGELFKRVNILMKHELKKSVTYLNISMLLDENISIHGNVNSLVQVINNMISNSIQAYAGKPEQQIDLIAAKSDNNIIISIKDYGPGIPAKVKSKLFKEMITTKGKNGTGLGLYMSYSTIKAHFNGDITVASKPDEGTTFSIILPI